MAAKAPDESLFHRPTPWAACAALEQFFASGGQCKRSDSVNWVGIAYVCAANTDAESGVSQDLHVALAWAHLAISIRDSLASNYSATDALGIVGGAMWVRINLIRRFGSFPGDHICDGERVIAWCMSIPEVHDLLGMNEPPPFTEWPSEVRAVVNMLSTLMSAPGMKTLENDASRLLSLARLAGYNATGK